jgi:hypothetical protein
VGAMERTITVPAAEVSAYVTLSGADVDLDALGACGRFVGARVECDLSMAAATIGADFADRLAEWHNACTKLARDVAAGTAAGEYAVTVRSLVAARQTDGKQGRSDLGDELDALDSIAGIGPLVADALSADPDWEAVVAQGAPYEVSVERDGNDTTVRFVVDADIVWPDALGGIGAPNELARHVTVRLNHARWRDRRVRRLVAVDVTAEELWPTGLPPVR